MPFFLVAPPALTQPQAKHQAPAPAPKAAAKPKWDGDWSLDASSSDSLKDRIESFTQGMNILKRTMWRKKLTNACLSYDSLSILSGYGFSFTFGKEVPINVDANGAANPWTRRDDEEKFNVSLKQTAPNALSLALTGDGYTLNDGFELDGDTLTITVTYASPKLDQAFDFKQVYKRND
ncbi:MAG: hypothetical protein JST05_08960 [Acidobacteria bacterium]|nr:hypothetical protein [Acidobacteriota bacterium]